MSGQDLMSILPLIILAGGTLILMLAIAIKRNHALSLAIALLTLLASFISLFSVSPMTPYQIGNLMIINSMGLFYSGLIYFATFVIAILAYLYMSKQGEEKEELYILLLLGALGSSVLSFSEHFATFFLGLEILSVSLYVMISYLRERDVSLEAGLKYLILAASSSAFLLFGMALIYAETGHMNFAEIHSALVNVPNDWVFYGGVTLMFVGIGFKLALVPFHMWTPDVYQGANAPVSAFIATVSKGGAVAILLRLFTQINGYQYPSLLIVLSVVAIASMFIGNLLALLQSNVKRILAYSSIAHLGYLMVALIAGGKIGAEAATFYIVAYIITTLGGFSIISLLSSKDREAENIEDYEGLFWRRPWLALVFTVVLFSLAGIPLTAGFIGKYYVLTAGVTYQYWFLAFSLVISSVIGLFYYLRIVKTMLMPLPEGEEAAKTNYPVLDVTLGSVAILAVMAILLVWIGVYPTTLMGIIKSLF